MAVKYRWEETIHINLIIFIQMKSSILITKIWKQGKLRGICKDGISQYLLRVQETRKCFVHFKVWPIRVIHWCDTLFRCLGMSFKVISSGMHQRPEAMPNLFFKPSVTLIWDLECGAMELDNIAIRVGYLKKNYTTVYFVTITLGYTCVLCICTHIHAHT